MQSNYERNHEFWYHPPALSYKELLENLNQCSQDFVLLDPVWRLSAAYDARGVYLTANINTSSCFKLNSQ